MNEEILSDIRNKLTVPMTALERLANGEKVPSEFIDLALKELKEIPNILRKASADDRLGNGLKRR